jgi:hypothetical protein
MVSCGRGGSIKRAAVAQQGHDTHRARPCRPPATGLGRVGTAAAVVAQGVIAQGEQPPGQRHPGDLGAAALGDLAGEPTHG